MLRTEKQLNDGRGFFKKKKRNINLRATWIKFSFFSGSSKMLCTILMNLLLMISLSTSLHCNKK